MKLKIDTKSIVILLLLFALIFVGYKWWSNIGDKEFYKHQVEEIQQKYELLEIKRDSVDALVIDLEKELKILNEKNDSLSIEIDKSKERIAFLKSRMTISEKELVKLMDQLKEARQKIEDYRNNPPIKGDDELLNSLKNNINK